MPNVVRFVLDTSRDLYVPGAGQFHAGVLDVDANNLAAVARARYLLQPYRAVELGIVDVATPPPNLPAPPGSVTPTPDPYPQYLTPAEIQAILDALPGGTATTSASITDFAEAARDAAAAMFRAGTNVTFTYDDTADTFTINASGGGAGTTDPEIVRDTIGGALVGGANIQITVNDASDAITIAVTGLATVATSGSYNDLANKPATDPAAGTAGLRTLGTGATQAAPGNHTHADKVTGTGVTENRAMTESAYTALGTKSGTTLYFLTAG